MFLGVYMDTYTDTNKHTHTPVTFIHVRTHTYMYMYVYTHINSYPNTVTYRHTVTITHKYIFIYSYIHSHLFLGLVSYYILPHIAYLILILISLLIFNTWVQNCRCQYPLDSLISLHRGWCQSRTNPLLCALFNFRHCGATTGEGETAMTTTRQCTQAEGNFYWRRETQGLFPTWGTLVAERRVLRLFMDTVVYPNMLVTNLILAKHLQ